MLINVKCIYKYKNLILKKNLKKKIKKKTKKKNKKLKN